VARDQVRVSAVVARDATGRVLTVRKRGTTRFMFPGGKPEAGESAAECAARECREEIGLRVDAAALVPLGRFRTAAANEAATDVVADVFVHDGVVVPVMAAEIAELRWLDLSSSPWPDDLAPLLAEAVLPRLLAGGR
jgi:8-oxo-dGTP diphosphatase